MEDVEGLTMITQMEVIAPATVLRHKLRLPNTGFLDNFDVWFLVYEIQIMGKVSSTTGQILPINNQIFIQASSDENL